MKQLHIVAIGGTLRAESGTSLALSAALAYAQGAGARTTLLTGEAIDFPNFEPESALTNDAIGRFLDVVRSADGVVIGSPGYHGSLSGLVKNALDHIELLRGDPRVYLDGMPVGIVATAAGWQAAMSTVQALRTITHALRGWPTPLGVAINSSDPDALTAADGQIGVMMGQMMGFLQG